MTKEKNITEFNTDIVANNGYLYTTMRKKSCKIANARITDAILSMANIQGRRVVDIGCGDGTYSIQLLDAGATEVVGFDAADNAIECAKSRTKGINNIFFHTVDIYKIEEPEKKYDVAILRGVLHHLYDVTTAIKHICKLSNEIIILEPNGYNPALKIIEKTSKYHIEHEEQSYKPAEIKQWFETCGGEVADSKYIGLVPMFCPDYIAKSLKSIEPFIEKIPLLRNICCGQYLLKIKIV